MSHKMQMLKKGPMRGILFAVIFLTFTLAWPKNVQGAPSVPEPQAKEPQAKAVLRHAIYGYTIKLPISLRQKIQNNGYHELEWEVAVPAAFLSDDIAILGSNYKEISKTDPTLAVRLTLHQSYWETWRNSARYVAIDFYKGKFERLDSSVTWDEGKLESSCFGQQLDGGFCNYYESFYIGSPISGQWYYQYPSWRGRYVEVNDIANQSGAISIRLRRGGSIWVFRFCVSQGGSNCD